jgi:hypothetical protein
VFNKLWPQRSGSVFSTRKWSKTIDWLAKRSMFGVRDQAEP